MNAINILSLCDKIRCGQNTLLQLGIPIKNYYTAEIKDITIQVNQKNYPNTIQVGDVNKIYCPIILL